MYSYCLSVQNSQWTNLATHGVPLQQQVGYDELRLTSVANKLSHISILQTSDVLSEAKCSLFFFVAAFCVNSAESDEGV
jgi:hypothetical protein